MTTFEDLSNELIYNIFDYIYNNDIISSFVELNKRFSTLVKDYSTPKLYYHRNYPNDLFASACTDIINPQRNQIWSIKLTNQRTNRHIF